MGGETQLVDDSTGPRALVAVTVPFALALLCFFARIYTRVFPSYRLNASDFMNSAAQFAEIITYSLFAASINSGFGRHASFITPKMLVRILQLQLATRTLGPCAATLARLSTMYQLVIIAPSAAWKRLLWVLMGFMVPCFFASILFGVLQYRPISEMHIATGTWDIITSRRIVFEHSLTLEGVGMSNDLAFAIMPIFLIWKLSRSRLERYLVSTLLALGLCATGIGIAIIIHLKAMIRSTDPLRESVNVYMYCRLEEIFLLIASSTPFLKAPVEHVLLRLGAPGFHNKPRELASYHSSGVVDSHELDTWTGRGLRRPKTENDV
ncbi:hypothetical protein GQ44DRAFT_684346 [Phaeosphaeriaceae sp. PMI808]|nr:hypothetical protein GQ44DRAFT_684346 [Phaeosphaeriaceae sp. PMI808]